MKESLGQRLARLRKEKGLTQEEVGKHLNISAQAISKWENDLSAPDISLLNEISNLYGTTIDEICGKENPVSTIILKENKKNIDELLLKIVIDSSDGDKVRVNIPIKILQICLESGMGMPQINGKEALKSVDFNQIFSLVEQGYIGRLVEIESADGDKVYITVE